MLLGTFSLVFFFSIEKWRIFTTKKLTASAFSFLLEVLKSSAVLDYQ
jgi:hypothetical protein